nr:uncharacterized mitochondrial protein AtMg00810-like [Tanacetum cinerariifolium]
MILNTSDNLGKFKAKGDEGYFLGYLMSSKAFRIFNKRTKRVEENVHIEFLENKAIEKGSGPNWLFDIDSLTKSMNYVPVVDAGTRNTDAPESNGNSNPTATLTNPPNDQLETLTVETPIPTASSPVPTKVWSLVDCPKGVRPIGTKWVLKNKKDERGIVIRNKAMLVAQGHTQEEGIDYDEVFAHVARIEAIRLFLAYASFMGFTVYQMDVKSAFLYGTIDEEGKDDTGKDVDLHLYRSMIGSLMYLTASRPDIMFSVCAYARHQVTPKECHLHAVKRIFRYLKGHPKLGLWYSKDSPFDLVAYSDSDYGGATQNRKSTSGGCQFLGRRLIFWQCKKQTIVATSTTKAKYVAAASCCGQVLWIQNQLLDYGFLDGSLLWGSSGMSSGSGVEVDSGCSRHMTGNISYLSDYEPFDGGYVSFGQGGCKITEKGTIKTDSECIVLGRDFKLLDDANILLRTPGQHNMYSIDLNNIVPHIDLTCLVSKASVDECNIWHRRLGKQYKASCKSKLVTSVTKPLHTLHMDLFGPTSTFFLKTKDETSGILRKFITEIENLKDLKVKIIRCDNRGEFRNKELNDFCSQKGIKREFSNARTPQQNGVAKRRNRSLIEAARTMLADAKLPVTFWAKAVNIACYVQNMVLVNKAHNKTPYELFNAFRIFTKRTKRVEENVHIELLENKAIEKGSGLNWLFDIDSLTKSMNYVPVVDVDILGVTSNSEESNGVEADEELLQFKIQKVWSLVDCPKGVRPIETKWVLKNKKDERGIVIRNKARLVAQRNTQEEGIDYDEVFAPVARIEAIKLFLAYASFMGFTVYQMDVKSAFLYGTIDEKVSSNTPMDKENPWGKDGPGKDVELHHYRSMIGSLMYLTASRPDIMFAV